MIAAPKVGIYDVSDFRRCQKRMNNAGLLHITYSRLWSSQSKDLSTRSISYCHSNFARIRLISIMAKLKQLLAGFSFAAESFALLSPKASSRSQRERLRSVLLISTVHIEPSFWLEMHWLMEVLGIMGHSPGTRVDFGLVECKVSESG